MFPVKSEQPLCEIWKLSELQISVDLSYEESSAAATMQNTAKSVSLVIIVKSRTNKNVLNIWEPDQSINQDTHTDVYPVIFKDIK